MISLREIKLTQLLIVSLKNLNSRVAKEPRVEAARLAAGV